MKHFIQLVGTLALILASGTGGYFLGKRQPLALDEMPMVGGRIGTRQTAAQRKESAAALDLSALHSQLMEEKNPLLRFKLAMRNLEAWIAKNPKDALAWLSQQPPTDRRDEVLRMALKQFAENEPGAAADWAMKNLKGADLNNALLEIAGEWAGQSGQEAAAWFGNLPASQERDAAVEMILFKWGANEPVEALEFIGESPKLGDLSPTLRRAALAGWAKSDPAAAVTESLALSQSQKDPEQFANTLANWATMDLTASSEWLLTKVPAGAERRAAAEELGTIYAQQSPESGVTWLAKLSAGAERDAAANALATTWSRSGPEAAATWASTQTTSTLTAETVESIGRNFLMKDPPTFQKWRSALPEGPLKNQLADVGIPAAAP
jgi:hypothetical protein